jgi:hypothetical protein
MLGHTLGIAMLSYWLLKLGRSDDDGSRAHRLEVQWRMALLLLLTTIDLSFAQQPLIATAPALHWRKPSAVAQAIVEDARHRGETLMGPVRVRRSSSWTPDVWRKTSASDRPTIGQAWDHDTLLPKYHLLADLEMVSSSSALRSADVVEFQRAQRKHPRRMTFEQYRIAADSRRIAGEPIPLDDVAATQVVRVSAIPRAWAVHEVVTLPPLSKNYADVIWRRSNEVLELVADRGFRQVAVVETSTSLALVDAGQPLSSAEERCEVISHRPNTVIIDVRLASPGVIVLADTYDANWRCTAIELKSGQLRDVPVLRTNRILRGVALPAGEHRLVLRYWPTNFFVGAILSAIGWLTLAIAGSQRLARSFSSETIKQRRDALRPG